MSGISEMIRHSRANACVECGKCSAACSMAAMYPDFSGDYSPRGMVQRALRRAAGLEGGVNAALLWRCLQCGNCSLTCPEGVDPSGLINRLRDEARQSGKGQNARFCASCGRDLPGLPAQDWLDAMFTDPGDDLTDPDDARPPAYRALCPVCRRQAYAANNG